MKIRHIRSIRGLSLSLGMTVFILLLFLLPLISYADETAEDSRPDIEVFAADGIYRWAQSNPYLKKIKTTHFWEDLTLSGHFIELISLDNNLEIQLGTRINAAIVEEMLKSPVEITVYDLFEKDASPTFILVMDIRPQFKALIKLAEYYAIAVKQSSLIKGVVKTQWMEENIYHCVRGNQLIVSNSHDLLMQLIDETPKDQPAAIFRNTSFYKKFHQSFPGNFKCRIDLGSWLKNIKELLDKDRIDLAVNMDLGETITYYPFFLDADPGFTDSSEQNSLANCINLVPKGPMIAVAGLYSSRYYLGVLRRLPGLKTLLEENDIDMEKKVLPSFNERFFFYIDGFQNDDSQNLVNGVMGFGLNKCTPGQREALISLVRLVMTRTGGEMAAEKQGENIEIYRCTEAEEPAFCVLDDWLLVAAGYDQLIKSLAVYTKKKPSLSDGKTYRSFEKEFSKNTFGNILVSPSQFFQALGSHIEFLGKSAQDFNIVDVSHKIHPLFEILSEIPPFGLFLTPRETYLEGKVAFVENK
jgi:hypothetical protein